MYPVPENFIMPMQGDIFFAKESQDKFGKVNKSWIYDRTIQGYFYTYGSSTSSKPKGVDPAAIIELRDKIEGRISENPLQKEDGTYRPYNAILITNIRDMRTQEPFFLDVSRQNKQTFSTQFEFHFVHPYVNPWNQIEYYTCVLNRIEIQELGLIP